MQKTTKETIMKPLVSIIVPVFNAEKYIKRCLDSILNQEYKDFELLLIDDGSTDASPELCDQYAASDGRIKVIHKPNTGVSDSRNQALDLAQGTYIQFLDSDDWITPDATKLFVRCADSSDCDMVISDFYRVIGENLSHKGDIEKEGLLTREEFADFMMENPADFYYGVLWNKLYKRDIIDAHHLRMDPAISWCEDFMFNLEYLRHCKTVYALQVPIYYYVKTKGSLVNQSWGISNTIKMKLNVFDYYKQFYREVYDEEAYENIRLQVYRFFLASAKDNFVAPGSKKLGKERHYAAAEAVDAEGIVIEFYRYRKLFERYCETIAIKNGLSLDELYVLLYLTQGVSITGLAQLSDLSGLSKKVLSTAIQKLEKKNLLRKTTIKRNRYQFTILPLAEPILQDLETAQADFDTARFAGFSSHDLVKYGEYTEKIKQNMQNILKS